MENNISNSKNNTDDLLSDPTDELNLNQKLDVSDDFDPNATDFQASKISKSKMISNNKNTKEINFAEIEEENDNYRIAPSNAKKDKNQNKSESEEKGAQQDSSKKLDTKKLYEKVNDAKQKIRESLNRSKVSMSKDENDSNIKPKNDEIPLNGANNNSTPQEDRPLPSKGGGYNLDSMNDERPLGGKGGGYNLDSMNEERPLGGKGGGYNLDSMNEDRPLGGKGGGYNLDNMNEDRPLGGKGGGYNLDSMNDDRPLGGKGGGYNLDENDLNADLAPPKATKKMPALSSRNKPLAKKKAADKIEDTKKDEIITPLPTFDNTKADKDKAITGGGLDAQYDFGNAGIPEAEEDDVAALTKGKLDDRLISKQWKVRKYAYLDLIKKVENGENAEIRANHEPVFQKILNDNNPGALEKGLDFMVEFLKNEKACDLKTSELVSVFIEKVAGQFSKAQIKKHGVEFMCILFEKSNWDDYKNGMVTQLNNAKKPAIIINAFTFLDELMLNFGIQKLEMLKPFYKIYAKQLSSSNAKHKLAAIDSVKNAINWMGEALIAQLGDLKKQLLDELTSHAKSGTRMKPLRGKAAANKKDDLTNGNSKETHETKLEADEEEEESEEAFNMADLDPYEIADPVDIFKTYSEDWSEKVLKETKWTVRKQMLDEFQEKAKKTPKFKPTDWGHFLSLTKKLFMDKNQNVTIAMIKCVGALAKGLRKNLHREARNLSKQLLDKMKDKNHRVTDICIEAFDDMYYCIGLENLADDINTIFTEKNPHQKLLVVKLIIAYLEKKNEKAEVLFNKLKDNMKKHLDDGDSKVREGFAGQLCEMGSYIGNDKMKQDIKFDALPNNKQTLVKKFLKGSNVVQKKVPANNLELKSSNSNAQLSPPSNKNKDDFNSKEQSTKNIDKKIPTKFTTTKNFEEAYMDQETAIIKMQDSGYQEADKNNLMCSDWKKKVSGLKALFEILESNISLSEEVLVCMQSSLKDFKEINPNVNKETFNIIIRTVEDLNSKKSEKFFADRNCSIIIAQMVERVSDGKYTELIVKCLDKMFESQSKKRIIAHFQTGIKAKTMNLKLAKELHTVFADIMQNETNWYELPVIELTDFVKTCISSSNLTIKALAIQIYKELYRTTNGKVNTVKAFDEISDKHKTVLENETRDVEFDVPQTNTTTQVSFY